MESRKITNQEYIPLGKIEFMDSRIFNETKEYRTNYMKIISFSGEYSRLIETPELLKKRYIKNVEISRFITMDAEDNDLILELSKKIVSNNNNFLNIPEDKLKELLNLYSEEKNDLTIITTWLVKNISNYININKEDIRRTIPQLTKNDLNFINKIKNTEGYYSIDDYLKQNSCSYETARTALERMTKIKLFEKTKQSKKFLYKPTNKLIEINKGGK